MTQTEYLQEWEPTENFVIGPAMYDWQCMNCGLKLQIAYGAHVEHHCGQIRDWATCDYDGNVEDAYRKAGLLPEKELTYADGRCYVKSHGPDVYCGCDECMRSRKDRRIASREAGAVGKSETPAGGVGNQMPRSGSIPDACHPIQPPSLDRWRNAVMLGEW